MDQQGKKRKNIHSFFKPIGNIPKQYDVPSTSNVDTSIPNEQPSSQSQRVAYSEFAN